uniref:UPAR/Ly6 domain-containing protein n=1 Tax=Hippocampus comes TaxID=109280 RepID=A0A3Q2Z2Q7_HIPCM
MKCLLVALLVFVLVSQGEALQCYCGGKRRCPSGSVEQCTPSSDACASVIFEVGTNPSYFKGCSTLHNCLLMNSPGISTASCCTTNLCNR